LIPTERVGAPFPLRIVLGIDVALLPAAFAGSADRADTDMAIAKRMDKERVFTGDLQGWLMSPV
jgi:hypothetical protein